MRYLITLSYDGTNCKGYQTQPGLITTQEEIEKALTRLMMVKRQHLHPLAEQIKEYMLKCNAGTQT